MLTSCSEPLCNWTISLLEHVVGVYVRIVTYVHSIGIFYYDADKRGIP